jgi:SAM-dependent methyltransferase
MTTINTSRTNEHFDANRRAWNERTNVHVGSAFYDVEGFLAGATSLKSIELERMGDVSGKTLLHLQCHFGQDTLSWARRGATVTGLDFSDRAIEEARRLAQRANLPARFVQANVYDAAEAVGETFDIVFTSYGTIGWLPDLDPWAQAVRRTLRPGGTFCIVEFHPFLWMFDNALERIEYAYSSRGTPIEETTTGTYADRDAPIRVHEFSWNHSLSDVFGALTRAGLGVTSFDEYDFSPYPIWPEMEEVEPGRFRSKRYGARVPYVYSMTATAPPA